MFLKLLVAMTVIPAVELFLLIKLGQWMGALETVAIIVLTGMLGAAMAKREGLAVWGTLKTELRQGMPPADRLVEGLLVLIGGILLMTPGVLTDLTGFAFIMPWSRRLLAPRLKVYVSARIKAAPGVDINIGTPRAGPAVREMDDRFDHPIH